MSGYLVVLVTVPDRKVGEKLSRLAVQMRLAACVNRIPGLFSRYWWKGKVETSPEELLVLKTQASKWKKLEKLIRAHHPYETCEILALKVARGHAPYLRWLRRSLAGK